MKKLRLNGSRGGFAIIDDGDYELVSKRKWHMVSRGYVKSNHYAGGGKANQMTETVSLHRFIMHPPTGVVVDHVNGDKLDNRRSNLRLCSQKNNTRNAKLSKRNTSGYKGVFWASHANLWRVRVGNKHVGYFKNKIEGAKAYNKVAQELFGDFARLNDV